MNKDKQVEIYPQYIFLSNFTWQEGQFSLNGKLGRVIYLIYLIVTNTTFTGTGRHGPHQIWKGCSERGPLSSSSNTNIWKHTIFFRSEENMCLFKLQFSKSCFLATNCYPNGTPYHSAKRTLEVSDIIHKMKDKI